MKLGLDLKQNWKGLKMKKNKKPRKIYLNDEDYNEFIKNGGVKTLEHLIKYGKFKLICELDEDGFPVS